MSRTRLALILVLLVPLPGFGAEPEVADVFVPKADGFASIRIPSVVVSKKGTVMAFAEGRAADADQAKNKLILKRSTDGGKTWGKVAVIAEDGDKALNNPCAVVEREGGQVLLVYQSYPAGVGERSGKIQPGYDGDLVVRNWLITSDDDGVTWSKPRDITKETKREKVVTTVAGGPGIGIQLRNGKHAGRILMPFNEGPFGVWNIYAAYSDDKGKTWQMGDVAPGGLIDAGKDKKTSTVNEAQFVELKDGSIRFNVRRWSGKAVRKTCVSEDGGKTWSKVEDVPEQIDPGCMGSVLRYTDPADGAKSRILYSGPQSTKRENGTVFVSYDEGKTWPTKRVLEKGSFAYSCLAPLPGGTIGCLYEAEGTKKVVFARFTLDWLEEKVAPVKPAPAFSLPVIDLNDHKERQVVVDREKGQYLGHPTTLLLEDGKTILCVYPKGHGRGPILYKRSEDGGKTWSDRLPTPKNWETSLETPTLHRVVDAKGKKRVVMFSGLYPCRMAVSEDDGKSWSELKAVGDWGGIVTMSSVVELKSAGHYLALFHDDGRFIKKGGKATTTSTLYKSLSTDGGLTWGEPETIFKSNKVFLCEPGAIRSPDGKQIAVLLRENFHQKNSHVIFTDDDGKTWTEPRELAAALNGDRHVAKYGPDGRLFVSFRDIPTKGRYSPTAGDWVGWVGTYDDLVKGKEGQYRIRLRNNYGNSSNNSTGDCGYAGVELLPDGTFVAVTYGHWDVVPGSITPQQPEGRGHPAYILSVRFTLKEIDELAKKQPQKKEK